jgi:Fe-Mn family superoxide dismutase
MNFHIPALHYNHNALEPYIDEQTMSLHHSRHHTNDTVNLNKLFENNKNIPSLPLEEIIADIRKVPEEIRQPFRNYGGSHLNHCLFWQIMGPPGNSDPDDSLQKAITDKFFSLTNFKKKFIETALDRFGSGWAWLCVNHAGRLEICTTPNQDSPIMLGSSPILGVDLWEHAYYLKYQNRREEYLQAWWHVINWGKVSEIFQQRLELASRYQ